jgi:hypothetical protein
MADGVGRQAAELDFGVGRTGQTADGNGGRFPYPNRRRRRE